MALAWFQLTMLSIKYVPQACWDNHTPLDDRAAVITPEPLSWWHLSSRFCTVASNSAYADLLLSFRPDQYPWSYPLNITNIMHVVKRGQIVLYSSHGRNVMGRQSK